MPPDAKLKTIYAGSHHVEPLVGFAFLVGGFFHLDESEGVKCHRIFVNLLVVMQFVDCYADSRACWYDRSVRKGEVFDSNSVQKHFQEKGIQLLIAELGTI